MFERYTERARRVIFFARYEASQYGSTTIESEHMLLGLLREDKSTLDTLLGSTASTRALGQEIALQCVAKEKVSLTMDLPLTLECKRGLAFAVEESETLGHPHVGTEHLLLGLLRVEECVAARILRQHGLELATVREALSKKPVGERSPDSGARMMFSAAPVFQVKSVARSVEWYRSTLGFDADPFGDSSDPPFAILRRESAEIMLQKADPSEPAGEPASASSVTRGAGGWDAYIRIHDARTLRNELQSKLNIEIRIRNTVYGCSEFNLLDPDGHVLVFGECG